MTTNINRTPTDLLPESSEGRIRLNGIFVGIIKDNEDFQRMGRLAVYIPELGGDPANPDNWYIVSYASPFAGATPLGESMAEGDDAKKMAGSQQAYGFWMVPPHIENQVLCCFVNGDTARGFWFACLYQQFMNHMVPGIGLNISTDDEINKKNLPPVVEYNKRDKDNEKDVYNPRRPVYEPLHEAFRQQGLYIDPERGPATTGARREAPSKVFGFLTPGGHTIHVDEDPENAFIRLRTQNGVQVLLHDTTGYVYLNSKLGNSWLEISDEGIDMYSKRSISMRAEENINIHADQNVVIHSGGAFHSTASNISQQSKGPITQVAEGDVNQKAGGAINRAGAVITDNTVTYQTSPDDLKPGMGLRTWDDDPYPVLPSENKPRGQTTPTRSNTSYTAGRALIGASEYGNGTQISSFIRSNTGVSINPSSTTWCGYFTGATLKAAGYGNIPSNFGNSQSWLRYGQPVSGGDFKVGDVAVWNNATTGYRHVGVVTGIDSSGRPIVMSGNSSNRVAEYPVDPNKLIFRRPITDGEQNGEANNPDGSGGAGGSGKQGEGTGNGDTSSSNSKLSQKTKPGENDHQDIKGSNGDYSYGFTKSSVTRLPTHEPWDGHPKSTKPPRGGVDSSSESGGGSTGPGKGISTGPGKGGGSTGPGGGATTPGGGGGPIPENSGNGASTNSYNQDQYAKASYVYDRYREAGYTHNQASAVVGNMMWESRMRTDARGDGGAAVGIMQWNSRREALMRYAAAQGKPWTDFKTQVDFSLAELDGSAAKYGSDERAGARKLRAATTINEAAFVHANYIERPAGSNPNANEAKPHGLSNRTALSQEFSNQKKSDPKKKGDGVEETADEGRPKGAGVGAKGDDNGGEKGNSNQSSSSSSTSSSSSPSGISTNVAQSSVGTRGDG